MYYCNQNVVRSKSFVQNEKGIFLVSGHSDSVYCWQLMSVDHSTYLQLIWSSNQNTLLSQNANMENARGLSENNIELLKQRGAIGNAILFSDDAKIASGKKDLNPSESNNASSASNIIDTQKIRSDQQKQQQRQDYQTYKK